ncbi:MAG: type III PLP-dependent enzyme [Patescibacteria group bacterium]
MPELDNDFAPSFLESITYEAPFFLFSRKRIVSKYKEFKDCFPGASIFYALKANSEPEVLRTLEKAGCGFEAASKFELDYLKEAKVPPSRIVYGTSVKPTSHIKEFFNYGVDKYAADSFSELEKIAAAAPGSKIYIRIIVNDTGSVFKMSEKFGTDKENVVPLLKKAKELGLVPYGISFNVGSQASNPRAWAQAIESIAPVIDELVKTGIKIEILNLGGGYPCRYVSSEQAPNLKDIAEYTMEQYNKLSHKPKLFLEPGRAMIAEAGILVTNIVAKVERPRNTWLFLDAGVYNALFEAMAYQGSTRYPITCMRVNYNSGEAMFALAGPTGDGPDVITREALLPKDIDVGDRLVIHNVGAYSLVVTSRFNGFPKPPVYFI